MIVAFLLGTTAGAETNGAQASTIHGEAEFADAFGAESGKGSIGCFRVVRLHKDPAHASSSPAGFEKARESRIISGETRRRSDGEFEFVPKMSERSGPHRQGYGLAMMLAFESSRGLDSDFKEWTVDIVEGKQVDERTQRDAGCRKRPIGDQLEL